MKSDSRWCKGKNVYDRNTTVAGIALVARDFASCQSLDCHRGQLQSSGQVINGDHRFKP